MSEFTTDLKVEPIDKTLWRLTEKFEYHIGCYPSDQLILVPVGFITDFASVPKLFWPIIAPNGKHGKAAVIHDYCYATGCCSKTKSDKIFLEGMEILKVKQWKREVIYWSVFIFGWGPWYKHRYRNKKREHNKK